MAYMDVEEVKESDKGIPVQGTTLEEVERNAIRQALEDAGGNRRQAAMQLHISERTLYRKIKDYGLE